jgi:hypothetical protein
MYCPIIKDEIVTPGGCRDCTLYATYKEDTRSKCTIVSIGRDLHRIAKLLEH